MIRILVLSIVLGVASRAEAEVDPTALEASGSKHFELAEYAAAIADFKEAFRVSDRPELLFNIAQAYRLSNDCVQARTFYKTYLRRVPDAQNAEAVRKRIDELEACANQAAPPAPPTEPVAPVISAPAVLPPAVTRTWKTPAGYGAIGAGVIGIGVGVVFAMRGSSKADELREACAIECDGDTARRLDAAGSSANRNAAIGMIAGGALVATGVVLVILDRRSNGKATRESRPAVSINARGAGASWSWRF